MPDELLSRCEQPKHYGWSGENEHKTSYRKEGRKVSWLGQHRGSQNVCVVNESFSEHGQHDKKKTTIYT